MAEREPAQVGAVDDGEVARQVETADEGQAAPGPADEDTSASTGEVELASVPHTEAPGAASAVDDGAGAGEVAWVIAELIPVLSEQTISDLGRLVNHSLSAISIPELREARLGLLIELVTGSQGVIPGIDDYNEARRQRAEDGEIWPAHTTLTRIHGGHWLGAVRAAMRVAEDGAKAGVATVAGKGKQPPYNRREVINAIEQCWTGLRLDPDGRGPSANEYKEWAWLGRRMARLSGQAEPRLPVLEIICKQFGSFERAIAVCRRERFLSVPPRHAHL